MVPTVKAAQQQDARTRAASVAKVPAVLIPVSEAEAVLATAYRAGPVPAGEEALLDPQRQQDLAPMAARQLSGAGHGHRPSVAAGGTRSAATAHTRAPRRWAAKGHHPASCTAARPRTSSCRY